MEESVRLMMPIRGPQFLQQCNCNQTIKKQLIELDTNSRKYCIAKDIQKLTIWVQEK